MKKFLLLCKEMNLTAPTLPLFQALRYLWILGQIVEEDDKTKWQLFTGEEPFLVQMTLQKMTGLHYTPVHPWQTEFEKLIRATANKMVEELDITSEQECYHSLLNFFKKKKSSKLNTFFERLTWEVEKELSLSK